MGREMESTSFSQIRLKSTKRGPENSSRFISQGSLQIIRKAVFLSQMWLANPPHPGFWFLEKHLPQP